KANLDYFVVDPAGKRLAGGLPLVSDRLGWVEIDTGQDANGEQSGENERVRVLVKQLDGGLRLGVGGGSGTSRRDGGHGSRCLGLRPRHCARARHRRRPPPERGIPSSRRRDSRAPPMPSSPATFRVASSGPARADRKGVV